MIAGSTNSGKQQTREKYSIYVLKTNVLNSGIEGLRMHTMSLACPAAYITGTFLRTVLLEYVSIRRNVGLYDFDNWCMRHFGWEA
jgi:hypothetical protein